MKNIISALSSFMKYLINRQLGIQGTIFLVLAIISLLAPGSDRFWMFMIASIAFSGMQRIVDEIKTLK